MSGLEPMISVKAAVIAQGPTGLEGLVVRGADLSPLQSASDFGRKQQEERKEEMCALYVRPVTVFCLFCTVELHSHTHCMQDYC